MTRRANPESGFKIAYPRGRARVPADVASDPGMPMRFARPVATLYGAVAGGVGRARRRARRRRWADVTIVSIGNLEVGGSGKTPFALYLLDELVARGHKPVYVSRGYRSEAERTPLVTVVRPDGAVCGAAAGVDLRIVRPRGPLLSRAIGDEGAMVAMRRPDVPLVICGDKSRAVAAARRLFSPSHVIVDDAYQTGGLHRDIDIVLLDAIHPFANGRVLPAGPLREVPSAIGRADWVGANGCRSREDLERFASEIENRAGHATPVFGIVRDTVLIDANTGVTVDTIDVDTATVSSIARPERLDRTIGDRGVQRVLSIRYPDHHRYEGSDVDEIGRLLGEHGCHSVVTTDKDWVKLRDFDLPFERVFIARLRLSVVGLDLVAEIERPPGLPAAFREGGVL